MKTITLQQLRENVIDWSTRRGIYEQSTCAKQVEKFYSERAEMITTDDLQDSYGDQMVCLINAEHLKGDETTFSAIDHLGDGVITALGNVEAMLMHGFFDSAIMLLYFEISGTFDPEECYAIAWNEIKKRAGLMVDGKFVKWDNLDCDQRVKVAETGQLGIEGIDLDHCKSSCSDEFWSHIKKIAKI